MYGESIVMVKKFDVEIFVELSVLRSPESKKVVYKKCLSVCVCVCVWIPILVGPCVCIWPANGATKTCGAIHVAP